MFSKFDERTRANMEIALERSCVGLPSDHQYRKYIADHIIQCAERGGRTLGALTEAGRRAASKLVTRSSGSRSSIPIRTCTS